MKIIQTVTTVNEYNVSLRDELKVFDWEDRKWVNAKVTGIMESGKLQIKCEDGIEFWNTLKELSDHKSYKFNTPLTQS